MLLLFGLLGIMMYFMSRRQRRAQEQRQAELDALAVGDRVLTITALYGEVADIREDGTFVLEIAPGVLTEWSREGIRNKVVPPAEDDDELLVEDVEEVDTVDEPAVDDLKDVKAEEPSLESGKQK